MLGPLFFIVKNIFNKLSQLFCKIAGKIKRKFAFKSDERSEFGNNNLEKISLEDGEVVRTSISISADIEEPLAYYHPGARYLTGKKGKFNSIKDFYSTICF